MKTFKQYLQEEMMGTGAVAGAGDDSETVVVRKKKKKDQANVIKRFTQAPK